MRPALAFLIAFTALGASSVLAQNPPLLTPPPPVVVPPSPVAPAPVPSVVTPLRTPDYGVPHGINTATPLSGTPRAVYRQPVDEPAPKRRHRKKHRYQSSTR